MASELGHSLFWLAKGSVGEIRAYFLRCRLQTACRTHPALLAVGVCRCAVCSYSGRSLVVHPVMAPSLRCVCICPTKSYVNLGYRQTYINSCGSSFAPTPVLYQLQPPVNLKLKENPLEVASSQLGWDTVCVHSDSCGLPQCLHANDGVVPHVPFLPCLFQSIRQVTVRRHIQGVPFMVYPSTAASWHTNRTLNQYIPRRLSVSVQR